MDRKRVDNILFLCWCKAQDDMSKYKNLHLFCREKKDVVEPLPTLEGDDGYSSALLQPWREREGKK